MARHRTVIKDQQAEARLVFRRALVAVLLILLLMGLVIGRLAYLQVLNYQHYTTLSHANRVKLVAIPPTRGLIYDRNGIVLAENRPSHSLMITSEDVEDLEETLRELGKIIELSESDLARFRERSERSRRFEEVPLKLKLSEAEVARLAVDRHRFPGVEVQAQLSRHYPFGKLASHTVGYVGRINARELQALEAAGQEGNYLGSTHIGKSGLELYYESLLHGTTGVERVETNAVGRVIRSLDRTPPIPGQDIYLTLDARLQAAAEAALGEHTGAVVAIDPATGEVLAFVSNPTFDPNPFVNGIELEDYRALQADPGRPLFNRALRGQYPPASTVKPFIGLGALHTGTVTASETVFCPGFYRLPGVDHRFRDWRRDGHGHIDLAQGIAQSCDVFFYDVAYRMGIDQMHEFMSRFGFGARTGIDLQGELSGLMPSREWKRASRNQPWFHGETLITGIGQGFTLATPLQLAEATATLANRGRRLTPHLLLASRAPDADSPAPAPARAALPPVEVKDASMWEETIEAMRLVVHGRRGTARAVGAELDFEMAGKTGTAQVLSIAQDGRYEADKIARELRDHALFIAFAPVSEPELAIAVVAENAGSGSGVAAPIARQVLEAYRQGREHGTR